MDERPLVTATVLLGLALTMAVLGFTGSRVQPWSYGVAVGCLACCAGRPRAAAVLSVTLGLAMLVASALFSFGTFGPPAAMAIAGVCFFVPVGKAQPRKAGSSENV